MLKQSTFEKEKVSKVDDTPMLKQPAFENENQSKVMVKLLRTMRMSNTQIRHLKFLLLLNFDDESQFLPVAVVFGDHILIAVTQPL